MSKDVLVTEAVGARCISATPAFAFERNVAVPGSEGNYRRGYPLAG